MGAHNFEVHIEAETPEAAYQRAVQDALYEDGHNPYNGTISTTSGFKRIPLNEGESLTDWHSRILDDPRVEKWRDCACVEHPRNKGTWIFAGWAAS